MYNDKIYIILKDKQDQGTIMDIIIKIIGRYINQLLPKNDFKSIFDVIMKNTHQKSKRNLENTFEKNIVIYLGSLMDNFALTHDLSFNNFFSLEPSLFHQS